ncbi:hypothetical protein ANABIO32_27760 [Rossellomorea marisflavi]|nr:hypothetical protein ANABIO32_27760 [Rossellomorea marisflavi]
MPALMLEYIRSPLLEPPVNPPKQKAETFKEKPEWNIYQEDKQSVLLQHQQ